MKNISLRIDYSLDYEIQRIKDTLDKSEWFIENGYSKGVRLPAGEKLEDIDKNRPTDYLFDKAEEEYNKKDYEEVENTIKEQWINFSPRLEKYFQETSLKQESLYIIQLTKYGVGGSYSTPNKVILNFQGRFGVGVTRTIIHEIVHLSIQSFINKYEVEHWVKERIVDLILSKIIPNINKMQKLPPSFKTELIDASFEKNYPNIEEIIKNL